MRKALQHYPHGLATHIFLEHLGQRGDAVDFVGKQEFLKEDLTYALRLAGETIPEEPFCSMEPQNVGDQTLDEWCVYTPELRDAVLEAEEWVLTTFRYDHELFREECFVPCA